ncbi:nucleotidyltransferase domain-containing protein [Bacillus tianshenii]|nr:nucleotidyltransferase domain-containing protein [Bacillus tianshenii]
MIPPHVTNQIHQVAKCFPDIQEILLFGSRAYGDYTERSDIDLAVIAPQMKEYQWLLFMERIEEVETLLKIDLIRWESAPVKLKEEIKKYYHTLYSAIGDSPPL